MYRRIATSSSVVLVSWMCIMCNHVSAAEAAENPVLPVLVRKYTIAIGARNSESDRTVDEVIAAASARSTSSYGWLDFCLYGGAVHAAAGNNRRRAIPMLDQYLHRLAEVEAHERIPEALFVDGDVRAAHSRIATYREALEREWKDNRWSLHLYEPGEVGREYASALSLRCLLSDAEQLRDFLQRTAPASGNGGDKCAASTWDVRKFWVAMRYRQLGLHDKSAQIVQDLKDSDSQHPLPEGLIARLESPPTLVFGFPLRGLAVAGLIVVLLGLVGAVLRRRHKRRHEALSTTCFSVFSSDPLAKLTLDWIKAAPQTVFLLALVFIGGGLVALAWSEETCCPQGYVVDRSFFDYLSFAYGFGLLVPGFLAATVLFYRMVAASTPDILSTTFVAKEEGTDAPDEAVPRAVSELWRRHARLCNSWWLTAICVVTSLVIVSLQKVQWWADPGTAFVDLRYPGHWSVTGFYFSVVAILVYYCVISCLVRGSVVLSFFATAFNSRWRNEKGVDVVFKPDHIDRCAGLQRLGWIMLLFYILLLLLAAQVLINMMEKFWFYDSVALVLHHTFLSVIAFAGTFVIMVPVIVGRPLLAVHLAMREYRWNRGLRLTEIRDSQKDTFVSKVRNGAVTMADVQALEAMKVLIDEVRAMPLWPIDVKGVSYLIASHAAPLFSVLLPLMQGR